MSRKRIYQELKKAQNECDNAKMNDLFDLCQYHLDFMTQEELSESNKLIISKFAQDVFKIAKLKSNLDPLI